MHIYIHTYLQKIAFTGSTAAGSRIMATCAADIHFTTRHFTTDMQKIAFTGSTATGSRIMATCAADVRGAQFPCFTRTRGQILTQKCWYLRRFACFTRTRVQILTKKC